MVVANVFFRASSVHDDWSILHSMVGLNGLVIPSGSADPLAEPLAQMGEPLPVSWLFFDGWSEVTAFAVLFFIVWTLPNTQQLVARFAPTFDERAGGKARDVPLLAKIRPLEPLLEWRPNFSSAIVVGVLAAIACLNLHHVSEFIYFEF